MIIEIKGDGNYLFKAISFSIYLKEDKPFPDDNIVGKLANNLRVKVS